MHIVQEMLHQKSKKMIFLVFSFLYRNFSEFLKILHKVESSLARTSTGSFVALYYLCLGISLECGDLSIDFFNKLFHCDKDLTVNI